MWWYIFLDVQIHIRTYCRFIYVDMYCRYKWVNIVTVDIYGYIFISTENMYLYCQQIYMVPIVGTYGYILLLGLLAISIYDYYLHVSMIINSPPPLHPPIFSSDKGQIEQNDHGELRNLFKPNFIINYFTQLHALINI